MQGRAPGNWGRARRADAGVPDGGRTIRVGAAVCSGVSARDRDARFHGDGRAGAEVVRQLNLLPRRGRPLSRQMCGPEG